MAKKEVKVKWNAKDTVFVDLFHISKYRYQLFQVLHPEMADVKETDIVPVTLNPIILNHSYNDLGLLVKDKLLIFVEAQSTWSKNILVRILLYLAMTYQDYITEHGLYVYGSKKIEIPEPESGAGDQQLHLYRRQYHGVGCGMSGGYCDRTVLWQRQAP